MEFLLLADVGAEADHPGAVFFLDPGHQHYGVEAARVSGEIFHVADIKPRNREECKVEISPANPLIFLVQP